MINKKGDELVEQTGSAIVAVLVIILLVVLIGSLVLHFVNSESQSAKKTLNYVDSKIKNVQEGESAKITVQGFPNSDHWYLTSWNVKDKGRIDKCFFDNCLCICQLKKLSSLRDSCQSNGICIKMNKPIITKSYEHVDTPITDVESGAILLDSGDYDLNIIYLKTNLLEIDFTNSKENYILNYYDPNYVKTE